MTATPDPYLVEHIRKALAHDPSTTELGVQISIVGDQVHLSGTAASQEHRAAIVNVVADLTEGHEVIDDLALATLVEDDGTEHVS